MKCQLMNQTKTWALWAFSLSLPLLGLSWQWGSALVLEGYMLRYSKETLIPGVWQYSNPPLPLVLVLSMSTLDHLRVSEQALPSARSAQFPDYPQLSPSCHSGLGSQVTSSESPTLTTRSTFMPYSPTQFCHSTTSPFFPRDLSHFWYDLLHLFAYLNIV